MLWRHPIAFLFCINNVYANDIFIIFDVNFKRYYRSEVIYIVISYLLPDQVVY